MAALVLLACGLPSGLLEESRPPTDIPQPATVPSLATETQAVAVTETSGPPPAPEPFEVTTESVKEESKTPPSPYIIELEYPVFSGGPEATAVGLNQQVSDLVARQRDRFEEMTRTTPADPQIGPHGLNMRYEVRQNDGLFVSLYFQLSVYSSGAAHPLPFSETLTYDVTQQRVMALGDLFKPDSDYLGVISQKCLAALQSQGITGNESGAAPTADNYRNWNLTPGGLLITFDPYQVAAYAVGFVPVTIPWLEINELLAVDV